MREFTPNDLKEYFKTKNVWELEDYYYYLDKGRIINELFSDDKVKFIPDVKKAIDYYDKYGDLKFVRKYEQSIKDAGIDLRKNFNYDYFTEQFISIHDLKPEEYGLFTDITNVMSGYANVMEELDASAREADYYNSQLLRSKYYYDDKNSDDKKDFEDEELEEDYEF